MVKRWSFLGMVLFAVLFTAFPAKACAPSSGIVEHMYNPNSGEHFYTANRMEAAYLDFAGWDTEGAGWCAPKEGKPVYRLYNPNAEANSHHYTASAGERDYLISAGWLYEGISWRAGGSVPVYRAYDPSTGAHIYTPYRDEIDALVMDGLRAEGIAWMGEPFYGAS